MTLTDAGTSTQKAPSTAAPLVWRNAGAMTYMAEISGRVAAVLYFDEGVLDRDCRGLAADAAWWLVSVDAAGDCLELEAPLLRPRMTNRELTAATYAAFSKASAALAERRTAARRPAAALDRIRDGRPVLH